MVDHFLEIHLHAVFLRCYIDVSLLVDAKVVHAPSFDVVELLGVFNSPLSHVSKSKIQGSVFKVCPIPYL